MGADLQPLAGAKVLIGTELNSIAGNFLTTDASGHAALPAAWTSSQPVTIEGPGHLRATYYAQEPGAHTYRLRKKMSDARFELKGVTLGHTIVDKDDFIDFSLVMPAMTRNDLLTFNLNSVISSQVDTISVIGQQIDIPSNVALPRQKETYMLPVTLEKPAYRLYFSEPGVQRVFAARGRFPFKSVVGKLRNNTPFYELINDFTISGGGVKDIDLSKPSTQADLSVKDLNFSSKVKITAPRFSGDETMLAIGVSQNAEFLIPTDVKRLKAGEQMQISTLDAKSLLISILKKTADLESSAAGADRLSAVLIPAENAMPQFLPMLGDPTLAINGDMLVPKMNSVAGVNAIATYTVLSQVQEVVNGKDKVLVNKPYWEAYAPEWLEVVSLPKWPEAQNMAGKKRWEVNLIGSLNASQVELGPAMINSATHVTHTSLDF